MERDWLRRQTMTCFSNSLPSALHDILPAEFWEEPELIFVETDDACSVVFDQPENLGDEIDHSSCGSEASVEDTCLWNPDFGWLGRAGTEDSGFLCGLLQQESVCTTPANLHEPWFLGLQGTGSTGEAADFSQGLVSDVGGRVVLNKFDTSTFLNVHDTVSASHELRSAEDVEMTRERLRVDFEDMKIDTEADPAPAGGAGEGQVDMDVGEGQVDMDVGDRDRTKREADQSVEDLEAEMETERTEARASGQPMTLDLLLVDDACQSVVSVLSSIEVGPEKAVATGPGLFDDELNSIKFIPDRQHTCARVKLGASEVLVWKPDEVIDDSLKG
eukprot:s4868_g5.t1